MKPHANTMIGREDLDPALDRCANCHRIAVSCDADQQVADRNCCPRCTH